MNASPLSASESAAQWQAETTKQVQRAAAAWQLMTNPHEPQVGPTPRQAIYRRNKSVLYRYTAGTPRHRTPVLMVPNLGISRPYIFDLYPGSSFIAHMVEQGFDFYLLDWGVFGDEDNDLTVDACVTAILPRMVKHLLRTSGAERVSLLGYCMGAPISACYAALHPEQVANLINMAGPIDYQAGGLFTVWLDKAYFDIDKLVDTFESMPAPLIQLGFKLLRPTMDMTTWSNLGWNLHDPKYVEGFLALHKWANEYVPFPGAFFRQWVKDFYQENKLIRDTLSLAGQPVHLSAITCPLLVVGAKQDYICPPACAQALANAVRSTDKEYLELPGGHISLIAGRAAARTVWPTVSRWLAQRSGSAAGGGHA